MMTSDPIEIFVTACLITAFIGLCQHMRDRS